MLEQTVIRDDNPGSISTQGRSSRRMRVAFVHDGLFPYFKGGAERRLHETAKALARRHDVSQITWQYWDGPPTVIDSGVKLYGVGPAPSFYGADGKRTVRESLAFAVRAARLLATRRFDIIDCCATPLLAVYLSRLASSVYRQALVVTWHEFWDDYWLGYLPHRSTLAQVARGIEKRAVPLADHIVAVSEFTAAKLRAVTSTPISIVENGVSLHEIDAAEPDAHAPDVLFAGRLIDDKHVDILIEAMAAVRKRQPSATCGIVGTGPEREHLAALAAGLGLSDAIRFYGFVEDTNLYSLIKGAKTLVLPSVREGFGMVIAEAQACGTVPIAVKAPYNAAAHLIEDGVDGLLSESDAASIAGAISRLLANPRAREGMASGARRTGVRRDWATITGQLECTYGRLLNKRGAVAA